MRSSAIPATDLQDRLAELERRVATLEALERPDWAHELPSDEQLSDGARELVGLPRRRWQIHPRQ